MTLPFKKVSELAHKWHAKHRQSLFAGVVQNALPLPQGEYPIFTRYP